MTRRQMQKIAKALADPRRFDIFTRIASCEERPCTDLRRSLPITAATLSHHLKELENAGLITLRRQAKFVRLRLRRDVWRRYLNKLQEL